MTKTTNRQNAIVRMVMYRPGKNQAWLAVVALIVLAILKLTGTL